MNIGMLWFDNSSNTLAQKIQKAADYFNKKYGRRPDTCLIHPSLFGSEHGRPGADERVASITMDGIVIRPYRSVLPGHLWIGLEELPVEVQS
ncbi:MAG TPA: hypothetical protein VJ785_01070 [Anaerolineales bacterium]|nr:hypothetical protein [Anaerolineales bacterium]